MSFTIRSSEILNVEYKDLFFIDKVIIYTPHGKRTIRYAICGAYSAYRTLESAMKRYAKTGEDEIISVN